MRIISKKTLREFWESDPKYLDAKGQLEAWHEEVLKSDWNTPQEVKVQFRNASILKNSRVVFNIKGNDYRLIVSINYPYRIVFIKFVGTYKQYVEIDAEAV
ncbi:type II toxin-antitoxin system HigB family toxin [Neptuniibacter sp. SY11_33]|uniref:type II toxin-antitoxin system HigB family toxin n=1 Tax=Neptuniibacter sp. SY11_33 TaxID=3398215 RepID=UPI0039F552E1